MSKAKKEALGLTCTQIAALLGVHPLTIYRWRNEGRLPDPDLVLPAMDKRRFFWKRETIEEWIKGGGNE